MQIAFDRAGMSLRRAGADVNITAEVTQTDESPQRSFGADFYVRTYAVQLDAEAPRFDSEEIGMPNTPPVRADSRVGADRFNEYARMVAPEVVERVRAFWQKQRQ
jgi:hypothetical protein